MIRGILFLLVAVVLAMLSKGSLKDPRSHGFYRYFAWLSIIGVVLLNYDAWFREVLSLRQLVSWALLIGSLVLVIDGTRQLRSRGRQDRQARNEASLLGFETTTELVTSGVYAYVRHPMYGSLLLLAWGAFFKAPTWEGVGLAAVATGCLVATAKAEEAENIRFFGEPYRVYMQRTKLFLPFLI